MPEILSRFRPMRSIVTEKNNIMLPSTAFVDSADGTKISYKQWGAGPGIILVHGAVMTSKNFSRLAGLLATRFTVYVPDRQGRNLSGQHPNGFGLEKEAEDIQALVTKTEAPYIFGLSSGAIITLRVVLQSTLLKKVILYEPPIPLDDDSQSIWFKQYNEAMAEENYGKAFVRILKGASDPSIFHLLPTWMLAPLLNLAMKRDARTCAPGESSLRDLVKAFRYDEQIVRDSRNLIEQSRNMRTHTLLLGGSKSQPFLKKTLNRLAGTVPHAERIEIPDVGHTAANNGDQPAKVAEEIKDFLKSRDFIDA
jgi:pimeloyl-ACP methyl ester carboxylesterase